MTKYGCRVLNMIVSFTILTLSPILASATEMSCDSRVSNDHWVFGTIQSINAAGGCAILGDSVGSPSLMAPFFIIPKINSKDISPADSVIDLSNFNHDSQVRQILEKLAADKSILIAIAPTTDNTGVVIDESVDSELISKIRMQFSTLPGIQNVKTIYALGAKASDVTVAHEYQHVLDLHAGRLPLSATAKNALIENLNNALRASSDATQADVDMVQGWLATMNRSAPEISAIRAEHTYLTLHSKAHSKFSEYLLASDHDFIAKHGGITEMEKDWSQIDSGKTFMSKAKSISCEYFKVTLEKFSIDSATFSEVFPSCKTAN